MNKLNWSNAKIVAIGSVILLGITFAAFRVGKISTGGNHAGGGGDNGSMKIDAIKNAEPNGANTAGEQQVAALSEGRTERALTQAPNTTPQPIPRQAAGSGGSVSLTPDLILDSSNRPITTAVETPEKVAEREAGNPVVKFERLLLDHAVACMEMTEDGCFVLFSHEGRGTVTVYDVQLEKIVATLKTKNPRSILSRGDQVFVANARFGTISVFSQSDWKFKTQLPVERPGIVHLDAPRGASFNGALVVTCHTLGPDRDSNSRDSFNYLIDTKQGRCREISRDPLASCSSDGQLYVAQDWLTWKSHWLKASHFYEIRTQTSRNRRRVFELSGIDAGIPFMFQLASSSYWLGANMIMTPIARSPFRSEGLLIPDVSQPLVYELLEDRVRCLRLNSSLSVLRERSVNFPAGWGKPKQHFDNTWRFKNYYIDHPVAYTHGQFTYLFAIDVTNGTVVKAKADSFSPGSQAELIAKQFSTVEPESAALSNPNPVEVLFKDLPLDEHVSCMTTSEDQRLLIASHEMANKVTVYDVIRCEVVRTLSTESPREVLSRGGKLFVANMGVGTVSVFDQQSWQLSNQLKLGMPNISCLSAPAGEHFKGQLLVSMYQSDTRRADSMEKSVTFLFDLETGKNQGVSSAGVIRVSHTGDFIVRQPQLDRFMFDDFVNSGLPSPEGQPFQFPSLLPERWHAGRIQALQQVGPNGYWFSFGGVCGGIPNAVPGENGEFDKPGKTLLIPNRSNANVCMLTENLLKVATLNCVLTPLGFRRIQYAPGLDYVNLQAQREKFDYQIDNPVIEPPVPVCVCHDDTMYLFVWDANTGKLLHARTPAFSRQTEQELVKQHGHALRETVSDPVLTFRRLPLDTPITFMAMTEDGRYLVSAHETDNRLSIYDVRNNELVKSVSTPSPRSVLCRGNTVFVSNFGRGTISTFDIQENWELSDIIKIHQPFIVHLSAPGGRFYDGSILAVCHRNIGRRDEVESHVYAVDTVSHNYREISDVELATVSYRGDFLAASAMSALDWEATNFYPDDPTREQPYRVEGSDRKRGLGLFYQLGNSNYWLSNDEIIGGVPLSVVSDPFRGVLIPDLNRRVAYSLSEDMLRMHRLDSTFAPLGSQQVAFAGAKVANFESINGGNARNQMSIVDYPIAVTHEGRTAFFVRDSESGSVFVSLSNRWRDVPSTEIERGAKQSGDESEIAESEDRDLAGDPARVHFHELPIQDPVTCRTLTEDGQVLVITHQLANLVTFYDVRSRRVISQAATVSPRAVLCRDGSAYVSNYGEGTISVFRRELGWKFVDQVSVVDKYIQHLSAPRGEYFQGKIFVNCFEQNVYGNNARRAHLVDMMNGNYRTFDVEAQLEFSYDGKQVVEATEKPRMMNYEQFFGDNPAFHWGARQAQGSVSFPTQSSLSYQSHNNDLWIGPNVIFSPTKVFHRKQFDGEVVADATQNIAYLVSRTELEAVELGGDCKTIGQRSVAMPSPRPGAGTLLNPRDRIYNNFLDHSLAATHGDQLHFFVLDVERNVILTAVTRAIVGNDPLERTRDPSTSPPKASLSDAAEPPAQYSIETAGELLQRQALLLESRNLLNGFPKLVSATRRLEFQVKVPKAASLELHTPIKGLVLTSAGKIEWAPSIDQIGICRLKIAIVRGGQVAAFCHGTVEVVDPELVVDRGSFVQNIPSIEVGRNAVLHSNHGRQRHLLLQENEMLVLEGGGLDVVDRIKLPNLYAHIVEREKTWVAATNYPEPTVDILSKENLKVLSRVSVQPPGEKRARIQSMELHPHEDETFVVVSQQKQGSKIFRVHEGSGEAEPLDIMGGWLKVSPDGRWLITGLRAFTPKGHTLFVPPDWSIIDIPKAESDSVQIDALIRWKLGNNIRPDRFLDGLGFGGSGIRMSPDGRFASYLSRTGLHKYPVVDVSTFSTDANYTYDGTIDLAYHPFLPIVALANRGAPKLFHRSTGKSIENGFLLSSEGLGGSTTVRSIEFSPDGMNLLLLARENGKDMIKAVRLSRSVREMEHLPPVDPNPYQLPTSPLLAIAREDMDALTETDAQDLLSPREISSKYADATVVVQCDADVYGTGLVVGKSGLILTAAHVVNRAERITVRYTKAFGKDSQSRGDGSVQPKMLEAQATLVLADEQLDLALLKVEVPEEMATTSILVDGKIDSGESVVVIGNPVLGPNVLSHTLTTGIVSNPNREIDGKRMLQISAPVNPGNSGGPMFNSRGYVIGLVSLKGKIENTAFAVPASALVAFLTRAIADP